MEHFILLRSIVIIAGCLLIVAAFYFHVVEDHSTPKK